MGLGTNDDKEKDDKKKLTTKKMPTKEDDDKENNDVQSINNKNINNKTKRIKRSQYVVRGKHCCFRIKRKQNQNSLTGVNCFLKTGNLFNASLIPPFLCSIKVVARMSSDFDM